MHPFTHARVAVVAVSAAVLVAGGVTYAVAGAEPTAATCQAPITSQVAGGVDLTVTCSVPTPAPVTETATQTVTTTATETATATATVTFTATPSPSVSQNPTISATPTPTPTATATPTTTPTPQPTAQRQACMSSPATQWDQRLSEVGSTGITGRRIFNQTLPADGRDGASLIEAAVADGMTPIVSYKLPNFSLTALNSGTYDAGIRAAGNYLNSLGVPVYATIWHEPSPDVSGANYLALQRRLAPLLKRTNVQVGPVLNSWVLDSPNNYAQFDGYIADDLIANGTWTFFGYDSYQSGQRPSEGTPGDNDLSTRMATINSKIAAHGGANLPQIIGEYNAYELDNLTAIQNTILGNDKILIACVFNSDVGSKGLVLTGPMLTSFRSFKANSKFAQ